MKTRILKGKQGYFQSKIDKLNRRAVKLNCPPIIIKYGNIVYEEHRNERTGRKTGYEFIEVSINGSSPIIDGWEFIGKIDHKGGGVVLSLPGKEIPEKYYKTGSVCDHCQTNHLRNNTYIIKKEEEYKQVGSACLKDFMGHTDPEAIANFLSIVWEEMRDLEDEESDYRKVGSDPCEKVEEVLNFSSALIRKYGWISRERSETEMITPTTEFMRNLIFCGNKEEREEYNNINDSINDQDKEKTKKVIEWLKEKGDNSNYFRNLKTMISSEYVSYKYVGYLGSAIIAYNKEKEIEYEKSQKKNEYYGEEGSKFNDLRVRLIFSKTIEGNYITRLHKFEDIEGRSFAWFDSKITYLEEGKNYILKGTVKKHNGYNGTKQTILTRVKVKDL